MDLGDEHLIRIEIQIERDGANAVFCAGRTKITQFGITWPFEVQLESALTEHFAYSLHGCFREIAFQKLEFFSLHCRARVRNLWLLGVHSSTWCMNCNCEVRGDGLARL